MKIFIRKAIALGFVAMSVWFIFQGFRTEIFGANVFEGNVLLMEYQCENRSRGDRHRIEFRDEQNRVVEYYAVGFACRLFSPLNHAQGQRIHIKYNQSNQNLLFLEYDGKILLTEAKSVSGLTGGMIIICGVSWICAFLFWRDARKLKSQDG